MISKEYRGSLYALLSGLLYGLLGYFGVSLIRESLSISNMLFWRFFIASLVIGIFILLRNKYTPITFHKDMRIAFINGAVFYGLSTTLYFFACPYIGSGLAMVIFFTYPGMVVLLNYVLFGKTIPQIYYLALFAMILGMCFLVDFHAMKFDLIGILVAIASGFAYAAYIISSKKIATLPPNMATFMVCLGCTSAFFFSSLANHSLTFPQGYLIWRNLFGIAILSTSIPILLLLYSLNYINSEKAAILSVLEPIFVLIFGVILLGEPMKLQYFIGVIIILSGALLTLFHSQKITLKS